VTDPREDASALGGGDLPPGFAVGEYRIERLIGRGGMGAVYAAEQPEIGAPVAIKVLAAELSRDPRLVKRFVDEARAVNKIRHPNIIDIFAFGRLADGREYFVMEYLEGETLAARLAAGPLPRAEARPLLLQICEALEAAHREKIVHRDLKPENLWIATPRHGQPYIKVLDFGIAKLVETREASMTTEEGLAIGTPFFMSPEQCRGEAVDHRSDVYALGVLLYLMFSGRLPFEGATFLGVVTQQITATPVPPSAYRPVPERLERLILSCLAKDPAQRPSSARALGHELGNVLGDSVAAETLPAASAPSRAARSGKRPLLVAAVVCALASAALMLALRTRREPPLPARVAAPVRAQPAPAAAPAIEPRSPTAHPRDRAAPPRPPKRAGIEQRGFLKENPFR
jgi:eukaryotic-like serine/threonine-protein kinase